MADFRGKRVLVTGAGKGIGRDAVGALCERGAQVVALSRAEADLASLQAETGCETIAADLADTARAVELVKQKLPIDLLVNNAGIALLQPALETTEEKFLLTWRVNTLAPLLLAQVVARDLIGRGRKGAVVNVSSIAASVGTPNHAAYCASKAGLDALTRVLAIELGGSAIRVNSINPVITLTPMAEMAWSDPAKSEPMRVRIPLRRFVQPREVTEAICFLLSDAAAMINGVSLDIDGGFRAG